MFSQAWSQFNTLLGAEMSAARENACQLAIIIMNELSRPSRNKAEFFSAWDWLEPMEHSGTYDSQ